MANRTLATLVRVAKHKVEQVQQKLATATAELRALEAQKADWLQRLAAAETATDADVYAIADTLSFAKRVQQQVALLMEKITAQLQVVEGIRHTLQKEYADRERYTQLHDKHIQAEARALATKVQNEMDDRAGGQRQAKASSSPME